MEIEPSNSKSFLICGLLFILLFTGCQSKETTDVVAQSTPTVPTRINLPTATIKPVTITATRQPTVTRIAMTITPIPSSISTLSLADKEAIASGLYETNADCELPCWWGIMPGETEWQTAKDFLGTFATEISTGTYSESDERFVAYVDMPVPEDLSEINFFRHYFSVRNGIIVKIQPETPRKMSITVIAEILSTYGQPPEVWIDTYGYSFGELDPFRVVLFYPEKGILVRYFDDADFQNDYVVGCFAGNTGAIVLWAPELELTFAEALNGTRALGTYGEQYYKPLEDATDMDVETFYETYLDPDTEVCIETPAELWMDR